jgi:transcriptional regulator of stress and heat shock response
MRNLADEIETYINQLLAQEQDNGILLRRNDLAVQMQCAPSQISYVLTTRFTSDRGYIVESRRGSGGYVRIYQIDNNAPVAGILDAKVGRTIDVARMMHMLQELQREKRITRRETELLRVVLGGRYLPLSDDTRAALLKVLMNTLLQGHNHF